ncbi:unnamed protein product, partial [Pylaiella littoralis]
EAGEGGQEREGDTLTKVVVREDCCGDDGQDGDIFLVDHAWTFQAGREREQLLSSEPLLRRMATLMQVARLGRGQAAPQLSGRDGKCWCWRCRRQRGRRGRGR